MHYLVNIGGRNYILVIILRITYTDTGMDFSPILLIFVGKTINIILQYGRIQKRRYRLKTKIIIV